MHVIIDMSHVYILEVNSDSSNENTSDGTDNSIPAAVTIPSISPTDSNSGGTVVSIVAPLYIICMTGFNLTWICITVEI